MNDIRATFGFTDCWEQAYRMHAKTYEAIRRTADVAKELVAAAEGAADELVKVTRAFTDVNVNAMFDVMILTGNGRGISAIKVARSMFEVSLIAEYLVKNPHEVDLYLDYAHVIAWKYLRLVQRNSPGKVSLDDLRDAEANYNSVAGKFGSNGRVRNRWSTKSLKEIAIEVGRADLYEIVYGLASMLHHVDAGGLIGHGLNWDAEALRIGHGALLGTVVALYNTCPVGMSEFKSKIDAIGAEFVALRSS